MTVATDTNTTPDGEAESASRFHDWTRPRFVCLRLRLRLQVYQTDSIETQVDKTHRNFMFLLL